MLAEGEELYSNILSQDRERTRAGSRLRCEFKLARAEIEISKTAAASANIAITARDGGRLDFNEACCVVQHVWFCKSKYSGVVREG